MDFDHDNVRLVVQEDRLSSLPDELIHQILSCIDIKFAVQTSLLSSRWKLLWTSMPCLNFSCLYFGTLPKFAKFVTYVLSHRNHQIEVSSVKLHFRGAASQVFVRKIANYAFSHNVQELTVVGWPKHHHEFHPCLFSSQSLKHFTLSFLFPAPCVTPKTPWDFPALTTLHLSEITLCDDYTEKPVDLFSKCVNLKSLTLKSFLVKAAEVFDIITPRLSNLMLIKGRCSKEINLIAPQLENLTIIDCSIKYLNAAPPGLSSLCYRGYCPLQLSKDRFHSLNKVSVCLDIYSSNCPYKEEDAHKTINLLQELQSARFLTLNVDVVECISSFPDLLSQHPSPFSNLKCLNIDSSMRKDAYKVKMSTQARNFLLENSPSSTFIMELPEAIPVEAEIGVIENVGASGCGAAMKRAPKARGRPRMSTTRSDMMQVQRVAEEAEGKTEATLCRLDKLERGSSETLRRLDKLERAHTLQICAQELHVIRETHRHMEEQLKRLKQLMDARDPAVGSSGALPI